MTHPDTPRHVQPHGDTRTYCGHTPTAPTLRPEDLERAQPGDVCPACLAQVMEDGQDTRPPRFTAYAWPAQLPRVLSETFPGLPGVHAYRLSVAAVLAEQGDSLQRFEFTRL